MYVCMYVYLYGWMDGWMDVCMYVCMNLKKKKTLITIPPACRGKYEKRESTIICFLYKQVPHESFNIGP